MICIKKIYWRLKSFLASLIYGFPANKLILIGVTGTDGKTSTTTMIYHILHELGQKVSYISTVGAKIGSQTSPIGFHVTTPRFFALHRFFSQAVKNQCQYFVLEVTSHAIDQQRVADCRFKIGVLTNITNEHLDYHKNFSNYAKTKLRLINQAEIAIVNAEPPNFYRYQKLITNKNIWYTGISRQSDYNFARLKRFGLRGDWVDFEKENLLLAYTVGRTLGFPELKIIKAINSFKRVKGRLDFFNKGGFNFLIDFAHTPNAFLQLYKAIKLKKIARIIHVFGCAGERDQYKRSKMGFLAGQNSQIIILTEEDYRRESLLKINEMIEVGIKKNKRQEKDKTYFFIESRQEAINFAVSIARSDDLIVITGKAHEQSLARGKKEYSWDEYQAVDQALLNHSKQAK